MKKINGLTTPMRMASLGVALTLTMLVSSGPLSAGVRTLPNPRPGPVLTTPAQETDTISVTLKEKRYIPYEVTVKDGDIIKICNEDPFYHAPFSYSKYNQFEARKGARLRPGDCMTHVVRNPTQETIEVKIFDEMHSFEKMVLKVTPAGGASGGTGGTSTKVSGPRPCTAEETELFKKMTGAWGASYGPVTFSGSCEKVTGHWLQGEWGERGTSLRGEIKGGRVSGSSLIFNYSQSWNNKEGSDSCSLTAEGKKLECRYLETLQR